MDSSEFDVIVIGSGPAGVSVAMPLVRSGVRVLMIDGGRSPDVPPPSADFLTARRTDADQWKWMIGPRFSGLANTNAVSPKLRVPTQAYVFDGFTQANRIVADAFVAIGSLAQGGLSNAWGCGVAALSRAEADDFPFAYDELTKSYETVSRRMGLSGAIDDDLAGYFGVDPWAAPPLEAGPLHASLLARYPSKRAAIHALGVKFGRSRVAVLNEPRAGRGACDQSGACLYGCEKGALYSAAFDLRMLLPMPGFRYMPGFVVDRIERTGNAWSIQGASTSTGAREMLIGRKVLLAAGTLATTRLVLDTLKTNEPVPLLSSPTAAFLLWLPRHFGRSAVREFGLGQISFSIELDEAHSGFGSTFSTSGLPVSEFASRVPFNQRSSIDILRRLLPSCVVGNVFLPGEFSNNSARLVGADLHVTGRSTPEAAQALDKARRTLGKAFAKLGAAIVPMSFSPAPAGSDIHYVGTLPMKAKPTALCTDAWGEVDGAPGLHVVDGACLPSLKAKSHTLTIMANADRIGRGLGASILASRSASAPA